MTDRMVCIANLEAMSIVQGASGIQTFCSSVFDYVSGTTIIADAPNCFNMCHRAYSTEQMHGL